MVKLDHKVGLLWAIPKWNTVFIQSSLFNHDDTQNLQSIYIKMTTGENKVGSKRSREREGEKESNSLTEW